MEAVRNEQQKEQEKDNMAFNLMNLIQGLDYVTAKKFLNESNWDINTAYYKASQSLQVPITVVRKSDNMQLIFKTFEKQAAAFSIVTELNQRFPLNQNQCYNLFKDQACTQNISYSQLTLALEDLQISGETTLYATVDQE